MSAVDDLGGLRLLASGACADVWTLGGGRVLKAFRRRAHVEPVTDWADHDAMTKAEFRAEARAYEVLQALADLEVFAPKYFGRTNPLELLSLSADPAKTYVENCGLVLEFIPGTPLKLEYLEPGLQERVEAVLERFRDEVKMGDVWDGSCFHPGTRAEFTVIDFGTWDGFADYQIELNNTGRLCEASRRRLERENAD